MEGWREGRGSWTSLQPLLASLLLWFMGGRSRTRHLAHSLCIGAAAGTATLTAW